MRLIRTLAFLLLVACAGDAAPAKFDPARDPAADVAHAVALASSQHKRVLVDVGGEWCSWCHIMDRFFETDREARELRDRGFVLVKVNYSKDNTNAAFLGRWPKIRGYPHLFVLGPDGALLHSQDTSELEAGNGYDRQKMLAFLRAWSP
ncbi:MAG TPA: thioredoxin family protein [Casimicrobiaceae bacterium]|jgi:thioredoxin-related protein|nr:thioredoxin family protein [Casimicrobiaceae bacterium]